MYVIMASNTSQGMLGMSMEDASFSRYPPLNMARNASEDASSAMRCAWNLRPSTMNVTSASVGLLTYWEPRYTVLVGCAGRQSMGAVALILRASSSTALAASRCMRGSSAWSTSMSSSTSSPRLSTKMDLISASGASLASDMAARCCTSLSPLRSMNTTWDSTRPCSFCSMRVMVFCTQSLEACTDSFSLQSIRRWSAPTLMMSGMLSSLSASP
mmetsp:Transcript_28795/g.73394  ORF Transcript_28795/g.73394 Transcript_28795/m.73394 type:complete len:214 (-) Transcript_28795:1240-1881(-)